MGTAFTPDALRGILIPDPRIAPSKTGPGSTYTQAEPQPGVPAPSSATSLVLESSGTQADTTILVQTVRAGGAVTTDAIRAGAFAWQHSAGASLRVTVDEETESIVFTTTYADRTEADRVPFKDISSIELNRNASPLRNEIEVISTRVAPLSSIR